jgi:Single-strand binding protein family
MSFVLSPVRRSAATISSTLSKRTFSTTQPSQLARMTLVGRLGSDPEIQQSASGGSFIRYSVGTSYGPKDNKQTSWFRVAAFPPEGSAQRDYVMGLGKG